MELGIWGWLLKNCRSEKIKNCQLRQFFSFKKKKTSVFLPITQQLNRPLSSNAVAFELAQTRTRGALSTFLNFKIVLERLKLFRVGAHYFMFTKMKSGGQSK